MTAADGETMRRVRLLQGFTGSLNQLKLLMESGPETPVRRGPGKPADQYMKYTNQLTINN